MCLREFMEELRRVGIAANEMQVRWLIRAGHISRPKVDGSYRFVFTAKHVTELAAYRAKQRDLTTKLLTDGKGKIVRGSDPRLGKKVVTPC